MLLEAIEDPALGHVGGHVGGHVACHVAWHTQIMWLAASSQIESTRTKPFSIALSILHMPPRAVNVSLPPNAATSALPESAMREGWHAKERAGGG